MSADRLQYLLEQLFHHACTEDDKEELALWIDTLQNDEEWKNGSFDFEQNDIEEVMRQIAKWYNIKVNYAAIPPAYFVGTISRNVNIPEVLKMLEMKGTVHFKVKGRTVTVMN